MAEGITWPDIVSSAKREEAELMSDSNGEAKHLMHAEGARNA